MNLRPRSLSYKGNLAVCAAALVLATLGAVAQGARPAHAQMDSFLVHLTPTTQIYCGANDDPMNTAYRCTNCTGGVSPDEGWTIEIQTSYINDDPDHGGQVVVVDRITPDGAVWDDPDHPEAIEVISHAGLSGASCGFFSRYDVAFTVSDTIQHNGFPFTRLTNYVWFEATPSSKIRALRPNTQCLTLNTSCGWVEAAIYPKQPKFVYSIWDR